MQTFLPYPSFVESARALDDKRLANQVNEALVLHDALRGAKAWRWHPAARMWRGHEDALLLYRRYCIGECVHRGIARGWRVERIPSPVVVMPPWLGWEPFHAAHRAALVNKDRAHYEPLFGAHEWHGYLWPVADHSYLPVARRARGPRAAAKACELFNAHHAVGARVEVWPGPVESIGLIGETTTLAYFYGQRVPVVFVRVPDWPQTFYSLTHVRVLDVDLAKVPYKMPKGLI